MPLFMEVIKICAVLVAAGIIGNWFLKEVRAGRAKGLPWYTPYLSPPGILIIGLVLLLPILAWWLRH